MLQLRGDEVVPGLALASDRDLCALDEDLGGQGAGVVVGGHGEAVGSRAHEGDYVVGLEIGEFAVLAEEVATFADGAHHIGGDAGARIVLTEGNNLVVSLVEGRADEIIHSGVDNLEGLGVALLLIEAGGEKDTGIPRDVTTGFEKDLEAEGLKAGCQFVGVDHGGQWRFIVLIPPILLAGGESGIVDDSDSSTDREELNVVHGLQLGHERDDPFDCFHERGYTGELGSDVHLHTLDLDMGEICGVLVDFAGGSVVDSELVFSLAGGDILVGPGVHVGVDAHRNGSSCADTFGHFIDQFEFGHRLDVEAVDFVLQRIADLLCSLAHPREGAEFWISASLDHAEEFTSGDNVESAAEFSEHAEDGEIGICFDGVGDLVIEKVNRLS